MRDKPDAVFEGAFDGDDLVAFTAVMPRAAARAGPADRRCSATSTRGGPGEGLGTLMLARSVDRGAGHPRRRRARHAGALSAPALAGRDDQADLLRAAGFEPGRHTFLMVADLPESLPAPAAAGRRHRRGLRPGASRGAPHCPQRRLRRLPGATPPSARASGPCSWSPRPTRGTSVLGCVARRRRRTRWRPTSSPTSTPSPVRRCRTGDPRRPTSARCPPPRAGLATALLVARAPPAAGGAGYATASLNVDTANPTGALGIYERAGFRQCSTARTPTTSTE